MVCLPAAARGQDLLDFVRADVGLCIEAHDLAQRIPELADAPFFRRMQAWVPYRQWLETDYRKLQRAGEGVEKAVGRPFGQFAGELFGASVVLAISPRTMDEPAGILLLRASDEAALDHALRVWNRMEQAQVEPIDYAGHTYYRRTRPARADEPQEVQFYFPSGPVLALSDREPMIRQALDLAAGTAPVGPLSRSEQYAAARRSLAPEAVATLYLNPRAWDETLSVDDPRDRPQRVMAAAWRQCESIIVGLRADRGLIVESVVHYDTGELPPRWRRALTHTAGPAEFLRRIPRRALVAFAGSTAADIEQIAAADREPLGSEDFQRARQIARGLLMGRDPLGDVLPLLGPNWGAYIVPRAAPAAGAVPVDGLLAIELQPEQPPDGTVPLRPALNNALLTGLNLLAAFHNAQGGAPTAVVKSGAEETGTLRWIESVGPYQPAYLLTDDVLVLASSPELIREFRRLDPRDSLASAPEFAALSGELFPAAGQVLFVNLVEVRRFLETHRDSLVEHVARSKSLSTDDAARELDRFGQALALFDGLFAAADFGEGRLRLVFGGTVWGSETRAAE